MPPRFGRNRNHLSAPASGDDVLTSLGNGERAVIEGFLGGGQLQTRLSSMGLHPGCVVTKIGTMPGRGPVTISCDGFRLALGWGIAQRVQMRRIASARVPGQDTPSPSA